MCRPALFCAAAYYCAKPTPVAFTWRGLTYRVVEVLGSWHLMDRWWAAYSESKAPSDRTYYRLLLPGHQVFEVYYDAVSRLWVLDVVHD